MWSPRAGGDQRAGHITNPGGVSMQGPTVGHNWMLGGIMDTTFSMTSEVISHGRTRRLHGWSDEESGRNHDEFDEHMVGLFSSVSDGFAVLDLDADRPADREV